MLFKQYTVLEVKLKNTFKSFFYEWINIIKVYVVSKLVKQL